MVSIYLSVCTKPPMWLCYIIAQESSTPASLLLSPVLVETDSEVEIAHSDDSDIVDALSWTAPLHDIDPVMDETMSENVFTSPQPHRSFKDYVGNKTDLGRAVIPAAILAGYTGPC